MLHSSGLNGTLSLTILACTWYKSSGVTRCSAYWPTPTQRCLHLSNWRHGNCYLNLYVLAAVAAVMAEKALVAAEAMAAAAAVMIAATTVVSVAMVTASSAAAV